MKDVISIGGKQVYPGECAEVSLSNLSFPTRTIVDIPAFVFRSKKPGPKVLFQAGMHGEEVNGVEIVRALLKREDIKSPKCGSVILVPIVNVVSFLMKTRDMPDGRDLNRCFPGSKQGSMGSRLAHDLMDNIISQIDFGVDFHTGGAKINNYPQLRCNLKETRNLELASAFAPPFILDAPYREKSLRKEAAKKGKHILVFEGGESQRFNAFSISEGINGCLRLLKSLDMIDASVEKGKSIILKTTTWTRAKESGMFRTNKKFGAFVEKDSVIGKIVSPFSEKEIFLFAHCDGFLIGINNQPIVNEGDALLNIGVE